MMKRLWMISTVVVAWMMLSGEAYGQSLKDILNSETLKKAVTSVTGGQSLTMERLQGTWTYTSPAIQLEGDNALKNIAGSVASTEAEKKLEEYCTKAGIVEGTFNYVFNADSTFSSQLKKMTLKGTYSLDGEAQTITFNYSLLGKSIQTGLTTLTAQVVLAGDQLTLLFDADKLLKFLSLLSTVSNNATLQAINKLSEEYEGMLMGFDLKR